jgi:hypothetical protein
MAESDKCILSFLLCYIRSNVVVHHLLYFNLEFHITRSPLSTRHAEEKLHRSLIKHVISEVRAEANVDTRVSGTQTHPYARLQKAYEVAQNSPIIPA